MLSSLSPWTGERSRAVLAAPGEMRLCWPENVQALSDARHETLPPVFFLSDEAAVGEFLQIPKNQTPRTPGLGPRFQKREGWEEVEEVMFIQNILHNRGKEGEE